MVTIEGCCIELEEQCYKHFDRGLVAGLEIALAPSVKSLAELSHVEHHQKPMDKIEESIIQDTWNCFEVQIIVTHFKLVIIGPIFPEYHFNRAGSID